MSEQQPDHQQNQQSDTSIKTEREKTLQRANFWSVMVDLLLSIGKTVAGFLFHSQALIVDGVHSFSDLITDIFVIWITRLSHVAPDEEHPYGHARFETAGTVIFGLFLVAVAAAFAFNGLVRIISSEALNLPGWQALVVAVIAVIAKEALYIYSKKVGKRLNSQLLLANAWHHRSDVLSTLVVIAGIAGARSGYAWLDSVAAFIVALMIAWVGIKLIWESIMELVDTSPFAGDMEKLAEVIQQVDGVVGVHEIRSRKMGPNTLLDAHIQVPAYVSVSEGHQIGDWVADTLNNKFPAVSEVIVHIDAEDDLRHPDKTLRPLRKDVIESLQQCWQDLLPECEPEDIMLHYLQGVIEVDLILPLACLNNPGFSVTAMEQQLKQAAKNLSWFGGVRVLYQAETNRPRLSS